MTNREEFENWAVLEFGYRVAGPARDVLIRDKRVPLCYAMEAVEMAWRGWNGARRWHPIENAPTDGTDVLVVDFGGRDNHAYGNVCWCSDDGRWLVNAQGDQEMDPVFFQRIIYPNEGGQT